MRQRHKREDYDFRQLKDSTTAPPAQTGARWPNRCLRAGNAELHEPNTAKDPRTHQKSGAQHKKESG